jgi:hypothetical protein
MFNDESTGLTVIAVHAERIVIEIRITLWRIGVSFAARFM